MVTPSKLDALFNPESLALIGASEKSTFAKLLYGNLEAAGLGDRVYLVNPRSAEVFGQPTFPSCEAIGRPIDLAYVMVPAGAVVDALKSAKAAGARGAVILSSGYSEAGEEGRARQEELVRTAEELDMVVLGPNVLGYVNVVDGIPAMALPDPPARPGAVALISQSGASCAAMKDYAELSGVDLSHLVTVGNEAVISIADIAAHLVEDERVRALAIFMESIKKPERFAEVARRALELGKPIVALKVGRSELAARAAASHTGALVGDDAVIDAVLGELGVIRVDTVEDMLVTAGLGAFTGPLPAGGLGIASVSGGACDIIADLADREGLELPELADETVERLDNVLPTFAHAHNPLDVTGAALGQPGLWDASIRALGDDPSMSVVAVVNSVPWREDGRVFYGQAYVDEIGVALASLDKPGIYVTQVAQPLGPQARRILTDARVPHAVMGLRGAVQAVAALSRWSETVRRGAGGEDGLALEPVELPQAAGALSEAEAREILEQGGIPFVPAIHALTPAEAGEVAIREWADQPVVVKIVSPDITHKTDVGGVRLGIAAQDVATVADEVVRACSQAVPDARIDGVLISPMRSSATELIVGVARDTDWGLMLAVGLGGVFVEALNDVVLARVPVTPDRAEEMLLSLKGRALLEGVRGRPAADLRAVAQVVSDLSVAAWRMGGSLETLEVNPLRVDGAVVEALDALVVPTGRDNAHESQELT